MRFRAGLVIGGVAGYVLGARAGRERYYQISRLAKEVKAHPAVAQLADQAIGALDAARHAVAGSLSSGGKSLRSAAEGNGRPRR